jgi:hypothetical protein
MAQTRAAHVIKYSHRAREANLLRQNKFLMAERKNIMTQNTKAKVVIDRVNRIITVSKSYNEKASIYGTPEYFDFVDIQAAHPNYRIIVKNPSRKSIPLGKITYEQMEKYIKSHDKNDKSIWNEYLKLRGKTDIDEDEDKDENEDEIRVKVSVSFFEVKKWFVKQYPCFKEEAKTRKKEIKKILEKEVV